MNQTVITKDLAVLHTSGRFWFMPFLENAQPDQVTDWTFCRSEYCYPEEGQEMATFNRIDPACHQCGATPDCNFAGYGSMHLLHNNQDPLIILCDDCAKSYQDYNEAIRNTIKPGQQLKLF